jgi:spermidine synthase
VKQKPSPVALEPVMANGLRRYLYFTAAATGAAIMVVEILGAKMLSPYVGMSHFVWTAQIAVTLVALACGYYAGGKLADRDQQVSRLYWAILAAAVYLAISVLICAPVAYWGLDFNLAVGSLLASAILFFPPLALLAMTGPFLVRVITASLSNVGGNVGRLTSISTLGSFAGTMLIGYVMIPLLPNSLTMYATAAVLMLVCVGYFGVFHQKSTGPLLAILVLGSSAGLGMYLKGNPRYEYMIEMFRGNSHFGQLQVVDRRDGSCRYYLNDNLIQNTYDPAEKQSESSFTYLLAGLARAYTTNVNDVLCIGLGIGVVPMDFAQGGARVDVVEINPAVPPVGVKFFNLQTNLLHLTIDDGRHYLNRCRKKYDVVVLDAFLGDSSPSHLFTREAFLSIRNVLRPGGTMVINCFATFEEGKDFFATSLHKTLRSVFTGVRVHASGSGASFFVATDRPEPEFLHPIDVAKVHPDALADFKAALNGRLDITPEHGRVLTDNYNPVEFFDAHNREGFRRRLAMAAKDM